ncbi:NADH-ubiquinone oxidoreductase chain 1 [Haplosporangium sp. Z 27]|nr:NADH-ubiquinone oxidoreductase chain 1 [Haplosporangium sp. Z 27]
MFKSVADRLGFPHSHSSVSSHHSSGASSPTSSPTPTGGVHRTSIFSSTPSTRSPSRQQQHSSKYSAPTSHSTTSAQHHTSKLNSPNTPRKASLSTPKPVLPPLSFNNTKENNLALSVANAGVNPGDPVSRAAENVTVTVRVRPFSVSELKVARGQTEVWAVHEGSRIGYADDYSMRDRRTAVDYTYDHALTGSDNELIYNSSVKDLVRSAMEGYNGTVFAYGQTSSGKTYTMSGTDRQLGVTPRAVDDVFKYIRENSEREFLLRVSYLEIYNESIRDLLSPEAIDLKIHEDRKVIESRERAPSASMSPTGRKMSFGLKAPTAVRVSQLNLIDLAGSEKASSDVERRKEGAFINKSLLTLGTVISKLTEDKGAHIPFRDSKLTRILQSSLSGNARVSVICTISPSFMNVEESHNTLKFAARVKKIITKAHTNQVLDDKALLEKYRREISELRAQLLLTIATGNESSVTDGKGPQVTGIDKEKHAELSHLLEKERMKHEEEMVEMNMVRSALKERIDHLTKLILTSQSINTKPGAPNGVQLPLGRYTVETSADGSVTEFPKEIETRLARKDTMVRQLQSELEAEKEKLMLVKNALQRTAKGEVVDIEKTLARVEMEPREKFLIEKRASIMNMNGMSWQDGANGANKRFSKDINSAVAAGGISANQGDSIDKDDAASIILPDGEKLAIDDEEEDEDLMDTPWNRSELISLRQAKRELEIVVIEQERKLEEMVSFEDSDDFRNLILEMEEQREKILQMEEEREGFKATITDLKNTIRRYELERSEGFGNNSGIIAIAASTPPASSPSSPSLNSTATTMAAAVAASKIHELEQMLQRERKLRMEEQGRNMGRVASLEAEVTILKAEQSVRDLA